MDRLPPERHQFETRAAVKTCGLQLPRYAVESGTIPGEAAGNWTLNGRKWKVQSWGGPWKQAHHGTSARDDPLPSTEELKNPSFSSLQLGTRNKILGLFHPGLFNLRFRQIADISWTRTRNSFPEVCFSWMENMLEGRNVC